MNVCDAAVIMGRAEQNMNPNIRIIHIKCNEKSHRIVIVLCVFSNGWMDQILHGVLHSPHLQNFDVKTMMIRGSSVKCTKYFSPSQSLSPVK